MAHSRADDPTLYYEWQKGTLETRQAAIETRRNELLQIDLATDRAAQQVPVQHPVDTTRLPDDQTR